MALPYCIKLTVKINNDLDIALGWIVGCSLTGKGDWIWHNGGTYGYRSCISADIENKTAAIVLSNVSGFHDNAWNIFYLAYRTGDKEKGEIEKSDYEGRIWRAKSVINGINGIADPYADMTIILQPDENSQPWEGQQAIATFNPYKVGDKWYAFYDGHNYIPKGQWPVGLATASRLSGPWKRMPEGHNPVPIAEVFIENPQVTELKEGGFLAVFDSFGDQEIAFSISDDGISWSPEVRIKMQCAENLWAETGDHAMRTPLCAIEEYDGTFTVIYTALMKADGKKFYVIGKCTPAWE